MGCLGPDEITFTLCDSDTDERVTEDTGTSFLLIPSVFGGGCIKENIYTYHGGYGNKNIFSLIVDWNMKCLAYCEWVNPVNAVVGNTLLHKGEIEAKRVAERLHTKTFQKYQWKEELGREMCLYNMDRLNYPVRIASVESEYNNFRNSSKAIRLGASNITRQERRQMYG